MSNSPKLELFFKLKMARKPNRSRVPLSSNVRVRMYRQRKKMKAERQRILNDKKPSACEIETSSMKTQLRDWANSYRISKRAIDSLLSILNSSGLDSLPKNHRTLLNTPVNLEIKEISGGKMWYNGLESCIKSIFSTLNRDISISLNFNIDGLPLFNSSKISFWPILASIFGMTIKLLIHRFQKSEY